MEGLPEREPTSWMSCLVASELALIGLTPVANGYGPEERKKFKRNKIDCSKIEDNNPTRLLEREQERLGKITELNELKEEMTKIIEISSISHKNRMKYIRARDRINSLDKMQMYLYNYILAGSGMQTKFEIDK
jgi:hypothetical protein